MNVVFEETRKTLMHGENAVVCTITDVHGSAPRKAGASMLVRANGKTYGTIGGGDLELFCTKKALEVHETKLSFTGTYELDINKKDEVSMICGGDVTVEFKYIDKDTDVNNIKTILNIDEDNIKVFIFGCGHVGLELAPVLRHLDFDVIMLDDREGIDADYTLCDYSRIGDFAEIGKDDYVVIMTHGHICDREVLLQVCRINPCYIGCIGSRKKVESTNTFLRENGIDESIIKSIHSPIGLPIGGDTPAEIAVSIASQLIQKRCGK